LDSFRISITSFAVIIATPLDLEKHIQSVDLRPGFPTKVNPNEQP
jgi:hypothetical protein